MSLLQGCIYEEKVIKMGYETTQKEDMSGHGWVKQLTFKYLSILENGKIICEEYDFYVKDIQHECGSSEYLWLVPEKASPFLACTWCKTVETLSRDVGVKRKRYEVSPHKAIAILLARGYKKSSPPMRPFLKLAKKTSPKLLDPRKRPKVSK